MATNRTVGIAYASLDQALGRAGRNFIRRGAITVTTSAGGTGSAVFPARSILGASATAINSGTTAATFIGASVSSISGGTISVVSFVNLSSPALGAASVEVIADYT
jgi:hypothetical protein